jgi:hypothetical protein
MRRTYVFFISLLSLFVNNPGNLRAQDTIPIPLKIKVGLEVSGPAIYIKDKNILNAEGYISVDINEKTSAVLNAGYLNYKYSQYNYKYINKGAFIRAGVDFNLLKPDKAMGKYWVGIGLRYGISLFNSEIPSFEQDNYWGNTISSIPKKNYWGHFVEVSPGVRAEIFKNVSIGWTVSLRMLVFTGTGKNLRPIYLPGFGNGGKTVTAGLNYFIVLNIPYKKINVIIKKEVPEETEDTGTSGNRQQATGIRP